MKDCKADIQDFKPDALILIDYGGFNRRMATFGKAVGIKVLYYIPPKVWAWRQGRAWQLKKDVDRMFVILPFEKEFYKKYDFEVDYVGNPVLDAIKSFVPNPNFLTEHNLSKEKKIIAFLPGSRKMELQMIVPLMAKVTKRNPEYQYVVAAVDNLPQELYSPLKETGNVKFVYDATYDLLTHAKAAIVTSGTATLETALFKVPQAVVYKAGELEYLIASNVIRVKFISLVNLIAGKEVVKEMIQSKANVESVGGELRALLQDQPYREKMLKEYDQLYKTLDIGSASENTAKLILGF
jgi:lipid-A-disaccharide synthase